ncbi:uncharacterized protein LOC143784316 [Ranitomeya variabilis]|uniref:uncharacterized protein LOC143784316 n=1 Tax=Ranitomeya variabilis TaxID=490064 RepID=UPI004056137F
MGNAALSGLSSSSSSSTSHPAQSTEVAPKFPLLPPASQLSNHISACTEPQMETQCGIQTKEHHMDSRDTRHQDILLNWHQVVLLNKDLIQARVLQALTPTQDIRGLLTPLLQAVFLVDMSFHQGRMDPMASMDITDIMGIMDLVFLAGLPKHMVAIIRNTRRISTMDTDMESMEVDLAAPTRIKWA